MKLSRGVRSGALIGLVAIGCGGGGGAAGSGSGGSSGGGGAGGTAGVGGTAGAGALGGAGGGSWVNPGCTAATNVVSADLDKVVLEIDLTEHAAETYAVKQTLTVIPDSAGSAVSLFGAKLLLGEASHGYAYDGQTATFCVEPFAAKQPVTIDVSYVVSGQHQAFPQGNLYGIRRWGSSSSSWVVGAYSAPFFASTWMLAPHTMPWMDPGHASPASVGAADLTVRVPDASWSVVGPGEPKVSGDAWAFSISGRMPLYALAFAASPEYVEVTGAPAASGLELGARVMPSNAADAAKHLSAARDAVDWMNGSIAPWSWPTALTYAEVPGYPGGFEHTSGVWLGTVLLDGGSKGDFATMHETVHHWFGNDVQVGGWAHFWLSEGVTEWLTVFGIGPSFDATEAALLQQKYRSDAAALSYPKKPGDPNPGPLRFANEAEFANQLADNGQLFYRYGAAFLEMVNQRLQRDHGTDLVAVLKAWYGASHGKSVTTEELRDFLIAKTGEPAWSQLFDDWVYVTPCPTLELRNYVYAAGQVSFELQRMGGANQDLPSVDVVLGGSPQQTVTVALPKGVNLVKAQASMPNAPTSIAVDPKGFYVLQLATASDWTGPAVASALP